ncbi:hypothetical protein NPS53_09425 [Pseudomonas putida]|uniref:hypothetical protein n=1 Tax=Pseudomonas putida TaxID=303 RepID=UPI0023636930|nr:hypothetical protein [Pseudomonas putida]MDD2139797.1 hypothetical protein [Pseudomonas putida]HDS1721721.1 hypothetical protein [Pseudomonas putida]
MNELPNHISVVHVWTDGDPSVGISGESVEIQATGQNIIDLDTLEAEDRRPALETYRQKIGSLFSDLWDAPAKVLFDFERAALDATGQQE